jgi:primary-amine oxidase
MMCLHCGVIFLVLWSLFSGSTLHAAEHPLDPLDKEEITTTIQVLKASGKIDQESRFPMIALREPPKEEVLSFKPGITIRREAFAIVYQRAGNRTFEAIVDCVHSKLLSWKEVGGVQPRFLNEDDKTTEEIVRADPTWQEALRKRGITDFEHVQVDSWSVGTYGLDKEGKVREARGVSYYKAGSINPYARPIEGVTAYVDLNAKKVLKVVDTGVVPLAKAADLDEHSVGALRAATKPLEVLQPRGASFELRGNEVRWEKWRFRFALTPREGLVLYTVGYEDRGKLRSVLYRASLAEMVVPYADPDLAWFFRDAFDEGEYAIGGTAVPLEPLNDAPPNARFFNALLAGEDGVAFEIPRALALYERDGGLLWKHVDERTGKNESRRARDLVLGWVTNVGNYEYGFNWIFHQDGSLEMELLITGIMQPKGVARENASAIEAGDPTHGNLVARRIEAPYHQHFFNFRLDMDVDGPAENSVVEVDAVPVPEGPDNPHGNAFVSREKVLRTEKEAQRNVNMAAARTWKVINRSVTNELGQPVGYVLMPGENTMPLAGSGSPLRKRAAFINAHFWVTRYDPTQLYAAGDYVNQSKGGDGLPRWIEADRSIDGQDVVLWYTMGTTHITRPEDWPVTPVHRIGFKLIPDGFFGRNPALDVPRSRVETGR